MNVFFSTFGCKVNSYETEMMAALLSKNGFTIREKQEEADIVVVNSCTVTASGDRKVRSFVRRAKRINPDAVTVLTGCFPQAFPDAAAEFYDADIITGNAARALLPDLIFRFLETGQRIVEIPAHTKGEAFEHITLDRIEGHTRAFLKIEDGCDRYCNYCIVPFARGHIRSMPLADIADQARRFAENGYKEIVLTGINLSSYGKGGELDLANAVASVAAVDGIVRVRLSSLEPELMTDELLQKLAAVEKLCPSFHLSLQSGSDSTLEAMGRRYTAMEYSEVADSIRRYFSDSVNAPSHSAIPRFRSEFLTVKNSGLAPVGTRVMFTTDIMVGYPTESDEDFEESLRYVRDFGFLKCHVFPYSPRPGTKAAELPQLSNKTKTARSAAMIEAADGVRIRVLEEQIGETVRVILEQKDENGLFHGFSDNYLPVRVAGEKLQSGDVVDVVITGSEIDFCIGTPAEGQPL